MKRRNGMNGACLWLLALLVAGVPARAESVDLGGLGAVRVFGATNEYARTEYGLSDSALKLAAEAELKRLGVAIDARTTPQATPMLIVEVVANSGAAKLDVQVREGATLARSHRNQFVQTWSKSSLYAGADPKMAKQALMEKMTEFLREFSSAAKR